jgi:hypothetical protein
MPVLDQILAFEWIISLADDISWALCPVAEEYRFVCIWSWLRNFSRFGCVVAKFDQT